MGQTEEVLEVMLKESTGTAMCDSGGTPIYDSEGNYKGSTSGYGRAWERNQNRKFEDEPSSIIEFSINDGKCRPEVTHNIYHWLLYTVSYEEEWTDKFEKWCESQDTYPDMGSIDPFLDHLKAEGQEVAGIYGDGDPVCVNTYNGEDLLSQTIQYTYAEIDDEPLVFLAIHQGCDVRGGYTDVKVFGTNSELSIFNNAHAYISCSKNPQEHNWYTDDAWHWYFQGTCGGDYTCRQLDNLPAISWDDVEDVASPSAKELAEQMREGPEIVRKFIKDMPQDRAQHYLEQHLEEMSRCREDMKQILLDERPENTVVLLSERSAICPFCDGNLEVGFY
jgi:hypothetical protein